MTAKAAAAADVTPERPSEPLVYGYCNTVSSMTAEGTLIVSGNAAVTVTGGDGEADGAPGNAGGTTSQNIKIELPRNARVRAGEQTSISSASSASSVRAVSVSRTIFVGSSGKAKVTYANGSSSNVNEDSRILLRSDGSISIRDDGKSGGSSGCNAGFGALALAGAAVILLRRKAG